MERHGREQFFVAGEGTIGGARVRRAHEAATRSFQFSRIGPTGRHLGVPGRRRLAREMIAGDRSRDSRVPAGYTYLGQFVDHDLTFDKTRLDPAGGVSLDQIRSGRSPSLDLDSLYGLGPAATPEFYRRGGTRLRTGPSGAGRRREFDLPRTGGVASIPDPRNDENLAVAQTHLAMIRFHNRVADRLAAEGVPARELFARARDTVVRHYQWMLRTDFLPRIVHASIVNSVFTQGRRVVEPGATPGSEATMPLEFSVAAFRFGHSMVRADYDWNAVFPDATLLDLFTFSGSSGSVSEDNPVPTVWAADWRRLYDFREAGRRDLASPMARGVPNRARRIDTLLTDPLAELGNKTLGGRPPDRDHRNLAFRNLSRARMLDLADGRQMAAHLRTRGLRTRALPTRTLRAGNRGANLERLNPTQRDFVLNHPPLWFYILREAETHGGRLWGVGGRLVAETFHRAMDASASSIVRDPAWRPTLGPDRETFRMVDLLLQAYDDDPGQLNPNG